MPTLDHNPRKAFDDAVSYAVQVSEVYLRLFKNKGIELRGKSLLELGPGADFAAQLVLVDHGVEVTLADAYLAEWDPQFHPDFYAAFLERWDGPNDAVRLALERQSYDGLLTLVREPAEAMPSLRDASFDLVISNAVLEHVLDLPAVIGELARVTRTAGIHTHQIDFRFHRDFDHPLDHLLMTRDEYAQFRAADHGNHGTALRMPEIVEAFASGFWLLEAEANSRAKPAYVRDIIARLPADSPYRCWPEQLLEVICARLWFARKEIERNALELRVTRPQQQRRIFSFLDRGAR